MVIPQVVHGLVNLTFSHSKRVRHLAAGADGRAVHDLSGLERGPLVALDPDANGEQTSQEGDGLDTHLLAVVHLGLGGPVEELDNVLGHLGGGGGSAILILDDTVEEDTGHSNTY